MPETTKATPNTRLRQAREQSNLSQEDVAEMIGSTALNVGRWERSITQPGPFYRRKLCELFSMTAQQLGLRTAKGEQGAQESTTSMASDTSVSTPQPTPVRFWNVPYRRNSFFTGRDEMIRQLRKAFTLSEQPVALAQPQAISGLGGIGKTQTAVEYAYRYRESYDTIFWVRAESADLLISDYLVIASLLQLPEHNEQEQDKVVKAIIRWLDTHEGWLLIFDNADDLNVISDFLPSAGKGHVLLTTRAYSTGTAAERIELGTMPQEEAILFLLRRTKRLQGSTSLGAVSPPIREQARAIVIAVDGLPLALDQAGAYIEETDCRFADYLTFYQTRRKLLLQARGKDASGHPASVVTTWSLAFEKVEQANPAAAELLKLCSFLHPDEIPEAMLREGAEALGPTLQPVVEDDFELNEAIRELYRYSLIKRNPEEKYLNIHRLVQAVVRDRMGKEEEREWAERVVRMMSMAFPMEDFATRSLCQMYLPHARASTLLIKQWNMTFVEALSLVNNVGSYLTEQTQYTEAELFLRWAWIKREQTLGTTHFTVAESLRNLGWLHFLRGDYEEANLLFQCALPILEQTEELDQLKLASLLECIGQLYWRWGKYNQSEQYHRRSLSIREQIQGSEHSEVALSLNNIALIYEIKGLLFQAEKLFQEALLIFEKTLGSTHPYTITAINNLGVISLRLGNYTQAETHFLKVLALDKEIEATDNADKALHIFNLALTYEAWGKYTQAEPLFLQSLTLMKHILGERHPLVATAMSGLAVNYRKQRKYIEAEPLFQCGLAMREQMLGMNHIEVALSLNGLGVLYYEKGSYTQAEALLQRARDIHEQVSPSGSFTAQVLYDIAKLYFDQQRYIDAEVLFQRSLSIREQVLGLEHPHISSVLTDYADLLRKTNREAEAIALEQRAAAIRTKQH